MNAFVPHPYMGKLARVLDRMGGLYTLQDILSALAVGRMQSFAENESWAITQVSQYPRAKVVDVIAVVGNLDDLRALHDQILRFAGEVGAGVVQANGRKGWIEDARKRGWRIKSKSFVYQREM